MKMRQLGNFFIKAYFRVACCCFEGFVGRDSRVGDGFDSIFFV